MMSRQTIAEHKYERATVRRWRRMTTIIGGKCTDGVVLIADRKVTSQNAPDTYQDKIFSPYFPIVLAGAGDNDLIDKFVQKAYAKAQEMHETFIPGTFAPISGGVFYTRTQDPKRAIDYIRYLSELEDIVRSVNHSKYGLDPSSHIDCLVGAWTQDRGAKLAYISSDGLQSDVEDYRVIGSGEPYTQVFLRSLLKPGQRVEIKEFASIGYFIIKWLDRFQIDKGTGLDDRGPTSWFIPESREAWEDEYQYLVGRLEQETNSMLENWETHGLNKLL